MRTKATRSEKMNLFSLLERSNKEAKRIPIRFALSVPDASQRVGSHQNQEKKVMTMYVQVPQCNN
jgi:hypothetical protein